MKFIISLFFSLLFVSNAYACPLCPHDLLEKDKTLPFLGEIIEAETQDNREGFFDLLFKNYEEEPVPPPSKIHTKVKIKVIDPFLSNYTQGEIINYESKLGSCERLVLPEKNKLYIVVLKYEYDTTACYRFLWETDGSYVINSIGRPIENKTEKIKLEDFKEHLMQSKE